MTLPFAELDPGSLALFLDFDGTLVSIAPRPELVRLDPATRTVLERLYRRLGGALAIVTGRDLHNVDSLLAPLRVPVAAVHGAIRRRADGSIEQAGPDDGAFSRIAARLSPLSDSDPRLLLESKRGSVALHFRGAPERAAECVAAMRDATAGETAIERLPGNMLVEARRIGVHKGRAVEAFMMEAPFRGRRPVFVGDDTTDEDGFRAVNALGGVSVRIGEGETAALARVPDIGCFLRGLARWTEGNRGNEPS